MRIKHLQIKYLQWILAGVTITLFSGYSVLSSNGAPSAKTGSPGDGSDCTSCHGGTATATAGLITSNIPVSGYVAGQTYQITATNTLTGSGKFGFEVSPQNVTGAQLGTLVAGTGSKLVGGTKYITQSNGNSTNNSWTFSWIAPIAGTGQVKFYGAFAKNHPGPVTLSSLIVQEASTTGLGENPAAVSVLAGGSKGLIKVVLNSNVPKAEISVFDLSGRRLLTTSVSGEGSYQLAQTFKPGVYIVMVQAGKSVFKKKIMII